MSNAFNPYRPYDGPCGSGPPPPEDLECLRQREIYNLSRELLVTSRGEITPEAAIERADQFLSLLKTRFDAENDSSAAF